MRIPVSDQEQKSAARLPRLNYPGEYCDNRSTQTETYAHLRASINLFWVHDGQQYARRYCAVEAWLTGWSRNLDISWDCVRTTTSASSKSRAWSSVPTGDAM